MKQKRLAVWLLLLALLVGLLPAALASTDIVQPTQQLYVADYAEPDRPDVSYFRAIREAAFRDLDEAAYLTAKTAVDYTRNKGQGVDPRSLETLEYYRMRMEEKGLS